jgi:type VI secretion system protein ImpG
VDERLLRFYNRELEHLREMGSEFAREFPKIAGRLGLPQDAGDKVADPYVERLLEGFAFLAGRVQLKLESEFPQFTQHLFETVYPHYLCPTPSMAMVRFEPDLTEGALAEGPAVPRGSILRSALAEKGQTRCLYSTAHEVRLWPLELVEAAYHTRDLSTLGVPGADKARAALRLRLRCSGGGARPGTLPLEDLVFHLRGPGATAMRLYEQIFGHARDVVLHGVTRPAAWSAALGPGAVGQVGFEDEEALLPFGPRSFHGYRLLQEYFAFPQRFLFARFGRLRQALRGRSDEAVDLTILFDQADLELEQGVTAEHFALFCTPAVNLFEKRLDRIHVTDRVSEFHAVPDRTAPLDYEVHSILSVTGYGTRGVGEEQEFRSFYAARDTATSNAGRYFAVHRVPRMISEREQRGRRRSLSYAGSETFIALVDDHDAPFNGNLRQLAVVARCTNRDLPLQMPVGRGASDFTLDTGAPVRAIRCVGSPTAPMPSRAEGNFAWRLVSHLSPGYLSISDTKGGDGASALREILSLYVDASRPELRRQIDGIRAVAQQAIVRRIGRSGPSGFARGLEVTLVMDEQAFEGSGIFLLGAVCERFFAEYVPINVFSSSVIRSVQRGEVKRWPARAGQQHLL